MMNLWIRSQDKTYLTSNPKLKLNSELYREWSIIEKNTNEILGLYKTKERAIEVLDEIQSLIETNFECSYNKKVDAYFNCNDVYEMPKE